jgi:FHS family L-fucose permease-like MFS transporter
MSEEMHEAGIRKDHESFWKQYRCLFGFVAQFAYVYVHHKLEWST